MITSSRSLIDEDVEFTAAHAIISIVRVESHAILVLEIIDPLYEHTVEWWDFMPNVALSSGYGEMNYDADFFTAVRGVDYPATIRDCPNSNRFHKDYDPQKRTGGIGLNKMLKSVINLSLGGRDGFFETLGWDKKQWMVWRQDRSCGDFLRRCLRRDRRLVLASPPDVRLRFRLSGKKKWTDRREHIQAANCLTWIRQTLQDLRLPELQVDSFLAQLESLVVYDPRTCVRNKTTDMAVLLLANNIVDGAIEMIIPGGRMNERKRSQLIQGLQKFICARRVGVGFGELGQSDYVRAMSQTLKGLMQLETAATRGRWMWRSAENHVSFKLKRRDIMRDGVLHQDIIGVLNAAIQWATERREEFKRQEELRWQAVPRMPTSMAFATP
jgi:hypothetical protein